MTQRNCALTRQKVIAGTSGWCYLPSRRSVGWRDGWRCAEGRPRTGGWRGRDGGRDPPGGGHAPWTIDPCGGGHVGRGRPACGNSGAAAHAFCRCPDGHGHRVRRGLLCPHGGRLHLAHHARRRRGSRRHRRRRGLLRAARPARAGLPHGARVRRRHGRCAEYPTPPHGMVGLQRRPGGGLGRPRHTRVRVVARAARVLRGTPRSARRWPAPSSSSWSTPAPWCRSWRHWASRGARRCSRGSTASSS